MFPYFYAAVMPQYCPSVCPSVTFSYRDHICWNSSKIISPPNSSKIVMWRFLRNRRLLLCLHTIFRALIYWANRAVILAIAWHLVCVAVVLRECRKRKNVTFVCRMNAAGAFVPPVFLFARKKMTETDDWSTSRC